MAIAPKAFSQFNHEKFCYWDDTSAVLDVLNGTWEMKLGRKKHKMTFSFDPVKLECIDSVNEHWYTGGIAKYTLKMSGDDNVYLQYHPFFEDIRKFDETPYELEIWIMDKKTFMLHIGADLGIVVVRKKRRD
jgi:hypothetical protein